MGEKADLLFVGRADVQVAQDCPWTHFVVEFGVGASVIGGSGHRGRVPCLMKNIH